MKGMGPAINILLCYRDMKPDETPPFTRQNFNDAIKEVALKTKGLKEMAKEIKELKKQLKPPLYLTSDGYIVDLKPFENRAGIIELVEPSNYLKLLPQFIDRVASGLKTIHIKKRPLTIGTYEIGNAETNEPTGLFVRVRACIEQRSEYTIDSLPDNYDLTGFSTVLDAQSFYRNYLEGCALSYRHNIDLVEKPEAVK